MSAIRTAKLESAIGIYGEYAGRPARGHGDQAASWYRCRFRLNGIVGPNANFIGVGDSEKIESVAAKMMGKDKPGGLLVYRRYGP